MKMWRAKFSSGDVAWMLVSWLRGRPSSLGMASGAVAGLVAITPAAGYVGVDAAIVIDAIAGSYATYQMLFRVNKGLDESLDAWSVHGIGGLWGRSRLGYSRTGTLEGC